MLRMRPFQTEYPTSVSQALSLLDALGSNAKICAGGTDLLPNLKHELLSPKFIISLSRIPELHGIRLENNELIMGAMTSLDEISKNKLVKKHAPSLADAALHVAGPQLRRMGTLGGNLCLDTRCLYFNQSYFWREALGFCLKKDGTTCHVTKTGKRCVAASSNDTATILLCLDAHVEIQTSDALKQVPLNDFYIANGEKNTILNSGDLLVAIRFSLNSKRLEGFSKLRHRESIDFPMLSIGVRFDVDDKLQIQKARVTINALAAKPKCLQTDWLVGRTLNTDTVDELAEYAHARCTPLTNICDDPGWRKAMVPVYIKRACSKALNPPRDR